MILVTTPTTLQTCIDRLGLVYLFRISARRLKKKVSTCGKYGGCFELCYIITTSELATFDGRCFVCLSPRCYP